MILKTKIKKFWNSEKSILAGDKDQRLKANEQRAIEKLISFKASILDLGCGEGSLLQHLYLRNKVSSAIGVDFSRKHIGAAKKIKSKKIKFFLSDVKKFIIDKSSQKKKFDFIITKRLLINLENQKEQIKFIENLSNFLKPNGKYIAVESSIYYYKNINRIRKAINLKPMKPLWHNCYIDDKKFLKVNFEKLKLYEIKSLFSTYYFFSRVINGFFKKILKSQPKYDDLINKIGWYLPQKILTNYSRERLYLFKKKGNIYSNYASKKKNKLQNK